MRKQTPKETLTPLLVVTKINFHMDQEEQYIFFKKFSNLKNNFSSHINKIKM